MKIEREIRFKCRGAAKISTYTVVAEGGRTGESFLAIAADLELKYCHVCGFSDRDISIVQQDQDGNDVPGTDTIITIVNVLPKMRLWSACIPGKWTLLITFIEDGS